MPADLDAIDRKILAVLQAGRPHEHRRIWPRRSACRPRHACAASACWRRRASSPVTSRCSIRQSVGLPVSVFVSIKLESQREEALDRFAKAIARWPEVLECYLMTGPRDYLLRVVVADLAAYERFLKQKLTRLSGIGSIEVEFALEQVKYTNVLPLA